MALFLSLAFTMLPAGGALADQQLIGAQSHATWGSVSYSQMDRELDLLEQAGATAVRADISWSSLETEGKGERSDWYVERFERFLSGAEARGIEVIATLWSTPCWASSAPTDLRRGCEGDWWDRGVERFAPREADHYADIAGWVAGRWGSRLAALEIWNEPNVPEHGFLKAPDPWRTYASLVKRAYPSIKAAAPELPVLAGAMAYSDERFLERLYELGVGDHFDGISLHPYNEWRDPDDRWKPEWRKYTFITGVPRMHEIMRAHGDGDKQLWLTEFGWSTCGEGSSWCVTPQQQAQYVKDSIRIVRGWSFVKAAILYNIRNKGSDPTDREHQFGLVHPNFTPKPGYAAFRAALSTVTEVRDRVRAAKPRLRIQGRRRQRLRRRGSVRLRLECRTRGAATRPGDRCVGALRLARRRGVAAARRSHRSRRFAIRAGRSRVVALRLSPHDRRQLARGRRSIRLVAVAATPDAGTTRRRFAVRSRS